MNDTTNILTDLQGITGIQGLRGAQGTQGFFGANGLQGVQGIQGSVGIQGLRGCDGLQGVPGHNGAMGAQGFTGRSGAQGLRGMQGVTGIQGVQGIQGATGSLGYMGYVGAPGEVGIQGLQGAKGHIWVDGASLDSYNTHLFHLVNNKLTSVDNTKLTLNNGAKISIWLNQNVYDYILNNNNTITVENNVFMTVDNVDTLEVNDNTSNVYYSDGIFLTDIINTEKDLNTIINLTYYNNTWYYSGGLIGSTDETPLYEAGKDITIDENTNKIDVSLDKNITTNIKVGFLEANETLTEGMSLSEILTKIMIKEIGGSAHVPTAKITINPTTTSYEVGTALGSISLTGQYIDGYYTSANAEIYTEDLFNANNNQSDGKVEANCVNQSCEYYLNNEILGSGDSYNYTDNDVVRNNQTYSFKCKFNYSNSQVNTIKTNLGNDENINIESGSTDFSNTININFYHTTRVGVLNNIYWNESINSLVDNQGNTYNPSTELNNIMLLENGGNFLISTTQNENNEYTIPSLSSQYIIVPQGVTFFIHASADPQKNNLISQYRKYSIINNKGITYDIYIYSNNGSAAVGVKGLKYSSINNVINVE